MGTIYFWTISSLPTQKIMRKSLWGLLILFSIFTLFACGSSSNEQSFDSSKVARMSQEEVEQVIEAFIMAEDSSTIQIPKAFLN